ncbi:phage gp6-like head-tail connector protein [Bradyrhizobium barranii subsp. barranii]|uniref:Phage gp6-like head-tail connector protein n=1 Tax=Bradyrhizobium barranii subsp. barranii TaxID=2823807 RepID=A0A939M648_9BRAD|nr:phage head-tail connector protein [Bradyrhizobium barranii]UEM16589.1 phage gp6-like head-tail connector protein [Bradyrhizobium barranii subsp. barranii]
MPSITLDQAKAHLNVTLDADDALLTDKLAAAKGWVSAYMSIGVGLGPPIGVQRGPL